MHQKHTMSTTLRYFVKYKSRHDKRYIMYISPTLYGINIKNHKENKHNINNPTWFTKLLEYFQN